MPNRLAGATSPYLLQHKDNPVEWWPWCPEAFAEAQRRDVPVLLSVGYAACHWCHVMAHQSFEDAAIAGVMNAGFVCLKVDREERPDVDTVYMEATQAMTGQGGWPMTCFLTPAGEPFFCGTYYPPQHFQRVLAAVSTAWRERRGELAQAAEEVVRRLGRAASSASGVVEPGVLDATAATLAREYDAVHGGFGGAPKFPPSMDLEFLLRRAARTGAGVEMVVHTCERMARGGIYDQLGGGFARYAVDATWTVPHFEKMLYDNALLMRVYLHLWRQSGAGLAERVVRETAEFLLRDLRTPEGGFASALDADSEGEEGRYYVWTPEQIGPYAAEVFGVTAAGTFEHDRSVLQLARDPDDPVRFAAERSTLLALRSRRVPPARDDKVVAAWNGLAVAALAEAGALLAEPTWVAAAESAADLLAGVHLLGGRLRRTSRAGIVGESAGVLEDYADVAEGLLALASVTGSARWLDLAGGLLDTVLARFGDGAGGLFDTADDAERLVRRPQDLTDNATPSGNSAAAGALLSHAALTGSTAHRAAAEAVIGRLVPLLPHYARFAGWAAAVGEAAFAGPVEIAVVGAPGIGRDELERTARRAVAPGAVVAVGAPVAAPWAPLLAGRPLVDDGPAAYVCRAFRCQRPVTTPAELAAALR